MIITPREGAMAKFMLGQVEPIFADYKKSNILQATESSPARSEKESSIHDCLDSSESFADGDIVKPSDPCGKLPYSLYKRESYWIPFCVKHKYEIADVSKFVDYYGKHELEACGTYSLANKTELLKHFGLGSKAGYAEIIESLPPAFLEQIAPHDAEMAHMKKTWAVAVKPKTITWVDIAESKNEEIALAYEFANRFINSPSLKDYYLAKERLGSIVATVEEAFLSHRDGVFLNPAASAYFRTSSREEFVYEKSPLEKFKSDPILRNVICFSPNKKGAIKALVKATILEETKETLEKAGIKTSTTTYVYEPIATYEDAIKTAKTISDNHRSGSIPDAVKELRAALKNIKNH